MSTGLIETPTRVSGNDSSQKSQKSKKRKQADDPDDQSTKKKKKQKKSTLADEHDLSRTSLPVKKIKHKHSRVLSPPPAAQPDTNSPSEGDAPGSSPIAIDDSIPQILSNGAGNTPSPHLTPEPSQPNLLDDPTPSSFHSVRLSLYLPVSAISLNPSTALPSLVAEHLSPLLLTYYAPAKGIVLAFSDYIMSSTRPDTDNPPTSNQTETTPLLAHCGDDYGASYTWLTATFLIFRPAPNTELSGWINVCSEGFVGLVSYNYFQTGVGKSRIPKDWSWNPPGGDAATYKKRVVETVKIHSSDDSDNDSDNDSDDDDDDDDAMDVDEEITQTTLIPAEEEQEDDTNERPEDDGTGHFSRADGSRVRGTLRYRVLDAEVVPGHDRDKWSLQIEGTLLGPADEEAVVNDERAKSERAKARAAGQMAMMSGGLGRGSVPKSVAGW